VFVPETTTSYNTATNALSMGFASVPKSFGGALTIDGNTTYNMVGVLRGDVRGVYVPVTGTGTEITNPPTLPNSYFTALSAATGTPSYVWEVAAATGTASSAALPLLLSQTSIDSKPAATPLDLVSSATPAAEVARFAIAMPSRSPESALPMAVLFDEESGEFAHWNVAGHEVAARPMLFDDFGEVWAMLPGIAEMPVRPCVSAMQASPGLRAATGHAGQAGRPV
jgi:hypothetical protein